MFFDPTDGWQPLMEDLTDVFKRATPFMKFLCNAVGVSF